MAKLRGLKLPLWFLWGSGFITGIVFWRGPEHPYNLRSMVVALAYAMVSLIVIARRR